MLEDAENQLKLASYRSGIGRWRIRWVAVWILKEARVEF